MAARSLRISVGWFLGATGLQVQTFDPTTGAETADLPERARTLWPRVSDWAHLLHEHYTRVPDDDVTRGWRDEDARRQFVVEADELGHRLRLLLGTCWDVFVSPEPGVNVVRLAGEYGCRWPLWVTGGGTGPESWPMLSPAMVARLERWAELADPDHHPGPRPDDTQTLRADLGRELGASLRVVA